MSETYYSKCCAAFIAAALFVSTDVLADAVYGFGSHQQCRGLEMPFPIGIQQPGNSEAEHYFNVIWVDDTNTGLDKYESLYINGNGVKSWFPNISPSTYVYPDDIHCTGGLDYSVDRSGCVWPAFADYDHGVSAFKLLQDEFGAKNVKVIKGQPDSSGKLTWVYLPVRKVKLLRIEWFTSTQPTKNPDDSMGNGSPEPLFFEYRATGNGDELKLVTGTREMPAIPWAKGLVDEYIATAAVARSVKITGSTLEDQSRFDISILKDTFSMTKYSDIQFRLLYKNYKGSDWESLVPTAQFNPFNADQLKTMSTLMNCN